MANDLIVLLFNIQICHGRIAAFGFGLSGQRLQRRAFQMTDEGRQAPPQFREIGDDGVSVAQVMGRKRRGHRNDAHAGRPGGADTQWGIFNNQTFARRNVQFLRGANKRLGIGLAIIDIIGADDAIKIAQHLRAENRVDCARNEPVTMPMR